MPYLWCFYLIEYYSWCALIFLDSDSVACSCRLFFAKRTGKMEGGHCGHASAIAEVSSG